MARLHFSMVILWRQLHIDFLRFVKWVTPTPGCTANFPRKSMQPAAYFASIRQIWSRATCRVSGRTIFIDFPKLHESHIVKTQLFMCLPPACFETGFGFVSGFEEGRYRNFPGKSKK